MFGAVKVGLRPRIVVRRGCGWCLAMNLRKKWPMAAFSRPFLLEPERLPLKTKISKYIMNFLKQESQALKLSLDGGGGPSDVLARLDLRLRGQLEAELDHSNKLFLLTSYNPIYVDPEVYGYFLEQEGDVEVATKNMLFRRLLFHQMYGKCWQLFSVSYTSLNDIEEFLDLCVQELQGLNHLTFGLLELILASQEQNLQHFRALVLETVCFKFKLNSELIRNCISIHHELQTLETVDDVVEYRAANAAAFDHLYINHIYVKRLLLLMTQESALEEAVFEVVSQYPDLTQNPGWLALVGPQFTGSTFLIDLAREKDESTDESKEHHIARTTPITTARTGKKPTALARLAPSIHINELDIIYAIKSGANFDYSILYTLYLEGKQVDWLQKPIMNHLFAKLIEQGPFDLFRRLLVQQALILADPVLVQSFRQLLPTLDLVRVAKQLEKTLPQQQMLSVMTQAIDDQYSQGYDLQNTADLIKVCNQLQNRTKLVRTILKHVRSDDKTALVDFYRDIVPEVQSSQILMEIMRSMVLRNEVIDEALVCTIFDKLLSSSILRASLGGRLLPQDFPMMYHTASSDARAKFHNNLRAMGQLFSLLNGQDLCDLLLILHRHIGLFRYCQSKLGKQYIYNNLVEETMRFIERKHDVKLAIFKMRDILGNLQCNAIPIRGYIFKLMVKQDPSKAIKLLQFYQQKKASLSKLIPYIILGIFDTSLLNDNRKIQLFDMFLCQMTELGYRHKITQSTAHQLMKLVGNNQLNETSKAWVANLAKNHKSIQNVVKMKARKLN